MNDNAVEAVINEHEEIAEQRGEQLHGSPPKNQQAWRMVDGKSFRLADEVRYVQRCAAKHDGRIITLTQLILFSTRTGDAWLLDPTDRLAARVARDGSPNPSISKRPMSPSRSIGKGTTA